MEIFGVYLVNQSSGITTPLYMDKPNIIGRGVPDSKGEKGRVLLPHPSISKIHAKIEVSLETHTWVLYDLSRHGTYINGKHVVKQASLVHGDKIQIGPFDLMFYEKFKADDETSEQPLPHISPPQSTYSMMSIGILLLVIQGVLALISPKILIIIAFSLLFFSAILLILPNWRKKTNLSFSLVLMVLCLGLLGLAVGYIQIQYSHQAIQVGFLGKQLSS